jgi:hypothetical protein
MGRYTSGGIGRDIVAGALAGAAAVWVIDKMQLALTHPAAATEMDPAHAAAAKAADAMGANLGDRRNNAVGHTVHYGVGAGLGALYGLLRGFAPSVSTGRGTLYGIAAFLLADEVGAPALGLAKTPLDYPAKAHARGALSHTLFGVFTDLGTRLVAPWRDEVIIYRGPTVGERIESGRHALEDSRDYLYDRGGRYLERGRDYLDRGRAYASDLAETARERAQEADVSGTIDRGRHGVRRFVDRVREYLPDPEDVADLVERGRHRARALADDVQSRLPDRDDIEDLADRGRKRARRFASDVGSRLPDRDDVAALAAEGRRRGSRAAGKVRSRLPDRADVQDMADRGRKRARRLAEQAQAQAEQHDQSLLGRALHWLFG